MKKVSDDGTYSYFEIKYEDYKGREIASLSGGQWVPDKKLWKIRNDRLCLTDDKVLPVFGTGMMYKAVVPEEVNKDIEDHAFKCPQPYKHQIETLRQALTKQKYGLFLEMGLGKTRIMIDAMSILTKKKLITNVLVITVKSMIHTWAVECGTWADNLHPVELNGTSSQKKKALNVTSASNVFITNYETLLCDDMKWHSIDMIVLDESQKIKTHNSKRTKKLTGKDRLFRSARYRYVLTGTPIGNGVLDIYPQIKFLSDDYLKFSSYYAFRNRYAKMGGYMNYQVTGYQNLAELEESLRRCSISLTKKDCLDLPEKIYQTREVEMSSELAAQYKKMRTEMIIEFEGEKVTATIALVKLLRLSEITSGIWVEDKNNAKLIELLDIIDDYGKQGIVIWCRFRKTMEKIDKILKEKGFKVGQIHGDITGEQRSDNIKLFQSGELDIMLGQITAGGVGITLTRASLVIYYENTFSYTDRIQSEDRTHRIGMKSACTYIDIVYDRSIDTKVLACLRDKKNLADDMVNNIKTILGE